EIDGIHIDDYFYPSGLKESADKVTYEEYLVKNPDTELSDYRRAMCDAVVSRMYAVIKEADYNDIFSISPSANIQTNYDSYYADVVKWASTEGYCDVMIPQVYFGFENATMPFEEVVDEWDAIEEKKVRILYGLAAYKVGTEDTYAGSGKYEWVENDNVLSRQIEYIMSKKSYRGFALYRYCSLFFPQKAVRSQMKLELTKVIDMLKSAKS
ncbi:MAG: family 10 glycosylhydrolase, partial [Erysipelotrichaceae bacterium]|nr:family 10 glycosylhydrolase [Erysipelotrichaceae bacterium]